MSRNRKSDLSRNFIGFTPKLSLASDSLTVTLAEVAGAGAGGGLEVMSGMTGYETGAAYPTPAQYYPGIIITVIIIIIIMIIITLQAPVLRLVTPGHTRVLVSGDTRGVTGARCQVRALPLTDTPTMTTGG